MPTVALAGYLRAVLRARASLLALDADAVRQLVGATNAYAAQLERALAGLARDNYDGQRFLRAALAANRKLAVDLQRALVRITDKNVELSYAEVTKLLNRAAVSALGADAVATLGITAVAPLEAAAAYLARKGTAATFRTLTAQAVAAGTQEVDRIIASAIGQGADPATLARQLRAYVQGSEDLQSLAKDGIIRLTDIPKSLQGAGRLMEFNARRIAMTEMGNAAHEAEVRAFTQLPHVRAVRWMLAPNRGTQKTPDVCDVLAKTDHYGLGPGVYPVAKVPAKPHPFDRCWLLPVMAESPTELDRRKPNPKRVLEPAQSPVVADVEGKAARTRLTADAERAVKSYVGPGGASASDLVATPAPVPLPPPTTIEHLPSPAPVGAPPAEVLAPHGTLAQELARGIGETPGFTPATTIEGARQFARETLGVEVAYPDASLLGAQRAFLDTANYMNEGMLRLKRHGMPMPAKLALEYEPNSAAFAWYTPKYRSITANMGSPLRGGPNTAAWRKLMEETARDGVLASSHPFGLLYHEYGHFLDHEAGALARDMLSRTVVPADILRDLWRARLIGPQLNFLTREEAVEFSGLSKSLAAWGQALANGGMSQYGITMKCEFIAETISRALAGQHLDPGTIYAYFRIDGPPVPGTVLATRVPVRV